MDAANNAPQRELLRLVDQPMSVESIEALLGIVLPPLAWVDALPQTFQAQYGHAAAPPALGAWWASVQHTLLSNTLITWGEALKKKKLYSVVLDGYFAPTSERADKVWQFTLATCSEQFSAATQRSDAKMHPYTREALTHILSRLSQNALVPRLLRAASDERNAAACDLAWSECVTQLVSLPTRAANVYQHNTPSWIAQDAFLMRVAIDWEGALSLGPPAYMAELVAKLAKSGFVAHRAQGACFWAAVLPRVMQHVETSEGVPFLPSYTQAWRAVMGHLGSQRGALVYALAQQLDAHLARTRRAWPLALDEHAPGTEGRLFLSPEASVARDAAYAFLALVAYTDDDDPMELVHMGKSYPATLYTPLLSLAIASWLHPRALDDLVEFWADATRCAHTSVKQEQFITTMLLAYTTGEDLREEWISLAQSEMFLQGVSAHLDHDDPVVRRLGMLVAECVSARTVAPGGMPLRFPASVWDGRGDGREVCRVLRAMSTTFSFAAVKHAHSDRTQWSSALQLDAQECVMVTAPAPVPATARTSPPTRRLPARVSPKAAPPAPRPLIEVLDEDDATPDTDEFHTYAEPIDHAMSSDEGVDTSDDEGDAAPGTDEGASGTLDTAFQKRRRAPVYIHELAPLARERDVHAQKLLLKHAEALVRRKTGWGMEIAEQGVDLCIALCAMQDHYGLHNFEARRIAALAALCVACPDPCVDCVYEQLFTPHYAVAQRIGMLHAVARAAQELAGVRVEEVDVAAHRMADDAASHARESGERRTATADPVRHAARTRERAVQAALRDDARMPLPFAPPGSVRPTVQYTQVALRTFVFPLVTRFFAYQQAHRRRRVAYAGSEVVLSAPVLNALLQTLAVLCYYAQNAAHFFQQLVPDVLELVDHVLLVEHDSLVSGAALSLALIVLEATVPTSHGLALVQAHAPLLARLQDAAQARFAALEMRAGVASATPELVVSPDARARRAAAAVVVVLAELQQAVQTALLGALPRP
ncbi:telomere binding protein [Malassezia brasiliensis]|uniref:Telomere binding protein n=1 Tax=Malassezia brasiliensis TaxID=1821822 RepID=A0AAF0DTM1_9BASI|nr:telomere binding protein [Malassezia brasiliensis]